MSALINVASTVAAATIASMMYLVPQQYPRHRPLCRRGLQYTCGAAACIAAIATIGAYCGSAVTGVNVAPQVLAFMGPLGVGGARALSQRRAQEGPHARQWLNLGLPLLLGWVENGLADIKQEQVERWGATIADDGFAVDTLVDRLSSRLGERRQPGTTRYKAALENLRIAFFDARNAWLAARGKDRDLAQARLCVATEDILRLVYELRADRLVVAPAAQTSPARPPGGRPRTVSRG